ncbi:Protein of unknown function [Gryllus bimaculatus]|nr:Protein of unknown function [Gryllus bimaculatus]
MGYQSGGENGGESLVVPSSPRRLAVARRGCIARVSPPLGSRWNSLTCVRSASFAFRS